MFQRSTVEIVYNETGYNEQPDITSRFGAEVRSRRCTYMVIAISVITRPGYNEQIRLDLGARYIRFLLYVPLINNLYFMNYGKYYYNQALGHTASKSKIL